MRGHMVSRERKTGLLKAIEKELAKLSDLNVKVPKFKVDGKTKNPTRKEWENKFTTKQLTGMLSALRQHRLKAS